MDDAGLVRGAERLGHRPRDPEELPDRHRTLERAIAERAPADPLDGEEGTSVDLADLVDRDDVRMVQRGERPRLSPEPRPVIGIEARGVEEELERDVAAERGVVRAVDGTHAALGDLLDDAVLPEEGAGGGDHGGILRRVGVGQGFSPALPRDSDSVHEDTNPIA
jgi:hypothetical protein